MPENNRLEERKAAGSDTVFFERGGHDRTGGGGKANHFGKAILRLIFYCKKQLSAICISVLLALVGTILTVIGPEKLKDMTNLITEGLYTGIDVTAAVKIAALLVILYVLSFICSLLKGIFLSNITAKVSKSLRTDISKKINRLPLRYFDTTSIGDTLSRVTNDVDTLSMVLGQSMGEFVTQIVMFFGTLVMMFFTNWLMALAAIAATALGFGLMTLIISHSQKYFVQQQGELGHLNGYIEEYYTGFEIVKAYNGEKKARDTFHSMNKKLYTSAWKSQFMSGMTQPLMNFIGNLGYVVVCVVGALMAWNGNISFGVIVAFILYVGLFTDSVSQFSSLLSTLQSAAAASERVFEFLDEEELENESDKKEVFEEIKGDVKFQNVRFGYEDCIVIRDFSMRAKSGQKIAIVGPTGAGKTTLVNLLMRFYEVQGGEILIDGMSISQISRKQLHSFFGMVLQDTWLFEGTIKENIVYTKSGVTDEEIITVCKAIGLHHFIKTLPDSYDTMLSDHVSLSAGQKQLITIARAMIQNAPMLILDEATSSVDTRTETLIQNAMDQLMIGRTSFVIAHRLSTIRNADLILAIKNGNIIENGTHEELMQKKGFYADLYNSQFELAS